MLVVYFTVDSTKCVKLNGLKEFTAPKWLYKLVHIQYRDINPSMSAIALLVSDEHKHFYSNICFQASHFKLLLQGLSLLHTFPLKAMTQPSVLDRLPALILQQSLVLTPECKSPAGDLLLEVASVFRGCWINAAQSCLKERKKNQSWRINGETMKAERLLTLRRWISYVGLASQLTLNTASMETSFHPAQGCSVGPWLGSDVRRFGFSDDGCFLCCCSDSDGPVL